MLEDLNLKCYSLVLNPEELEYGEYIGQGRRGVVYSAVHITSGTSLAIKTINIYDRDKRH